MEKWNVVERKERNTPSMDYARRIFSQGGSEVFRMFSEVEYVSTLYFLSYLKDHQELLGLRDQQLEQIAMVCKRMICAYQGKKRNKEKIAYGDKAMPSYVHLLQASIYPLSAYITLKEGINGTNSDANKIVNSIFADQAGSEGPIQAVEGFMQDIESGTNSFQYIIATLLHDSAEDLKGVVEGNGEILGTDGYGIHTEITKNKHRDINQGTVGQLAKELGAMLLDDEEEKYSDQLKELEGSHFPVLFAFQKSLAEKCRKFEQEFTRDPLDYLPEIAENLIYERHEDGSYIELFTQISLFKQYHFLRDCGISKGETQNIVGIVDKVTIRKHTDEAIEKAEKLKMINRIKHDYGVFFVKFGDVMHNAMTLASNPNMKTYIDDLLKIKEAYEKGEELPPLSDYTDEEKRLKDKYEEYILYLYYGGYGWIDKVFDHVIRNYSLRKLEKETGEDLGYFRESSWYVHKENPLKIWLEILNYRYKKFQKLDHKSLDYDQLHQIIGTNMDESTQEILQEVGLQMIENQFQDEKILEDFDMKWDFSSLDFFSMAGIGKHKIDRLIMVMLGEEGCQVGGDRLLGLTENGLKSLNKHFSNALEFYQKDLGGRIPKGFFGDWGKGNIGFGSLQKLREFIAKSADKNYAFRHIVCSLLKVLYEEFLVSKDARTEEQELLFYTKVIGELFFTKENQKGLFRAVSSTHNKKLKYLYDSILKGDEDAKAQFLQLAKQLKFRKSSNFIYDQFSYLLTLRNSSEQFDSEIVEYMISVVSNNIIHGISARTKSSVSTKIKLISDPKYDRPELIRDNYALRFEVNTVDDVIELAQYLFMMYYSFDENIIIKIKNIIDKDTFVRKYGGPPRLLDDRFYDHVMVTFARDDEIKGDKDRQDFKLIGKLHPEFPFDIEAQVVLTDNMNEVGYAHHGVYEIKRIIRSMMRLQGVVDDTYIRRIILMKISEYGRDLTHLGQYDVDITAASIYQYLMEDRSLFCPVKIKGGRQNKKYFMNKKTYIGLNFWGLLDDHSILGADISGTGEYTNVIPKKEFDTYMRKSRDELLDKEGLCSTLQTKLNLRQKVMSGSDSIISCRDVLSNIEKELVDLLADECADHAMYTVLGNEKDRDVLRRNILQKTRSYYKNTQKLKATWKKVDEEFKKAA